MRLSFVFRRLALPLLFLALPAQAAFAQSSLSASSAPAASSLEVVISGPTDIGVGRTIILDASLSQIAGENVTYQWFLGDDRVAISKAVEAVYTPEKPGILLFRAVISATINGSPVTAEAMHAVTVYRRKVVLVADSSVPKDKLAIHEQEAAQAGVFLRVLQAGDSAVPLGGEEALSALLTQEKESLIGADEIIVWTEGITGLQALMRSVQADEDLLAAMRNQTIVAVTGRGLSTYARTARGTYTVLRPKEIIVTRKEAIPLLIANDGIDALVLDLDQRDIDMQRIDESTAGIRPWNVLSTLVNSMLSNGVPSQTVILLLVLPVIATILAFLKQVIGITTFGLYTPSIITLSLLALGWQLGIFFLLFIIFTGYATRSLMRRWRLLYIPKVAIILTVVSITLLLLTGISASLGITFSRETIFILLIMSTLAESFLNLKTEQGWYSAILGVGETILAALLCMFIVQWGMFQSLVIAYPELVLLTIVFNAVLGRWTGLRLLEYVRFREVFKHMQQEE